MSLDLVEAYRRFTGKMRRDDNAVDHAQQVVGGSGDIRFVDRAQGVIKTCRRKIQPAVGREKYRRIPNEILKLRRIENNKLVIGIPSRKTRDL